jgi:hypothetical protein
MFVAVLFTVAELRNQPKCPTANDWVKKAWCIYTKEYYSTVKNDKYMSFAGK